MKGHRYLLKACRILKERGIDLRCHLVGSGPQKHALEEQIEQEELRDVVQLHGGQPRESVARLLAAMDVAVLASHPTPDGKREGVPVALMEAMAAGLPVVASGISGIPELVDDGSTGLLVPSGDPIAVAEALERLSFDPELRRAMGQAGRARVVREFSLTANTDRLLSLFPAPAPDREQRLAVAEPH